MADDPIRLEASGKAHALSSQEWQQLLEAAEEAGSLRQSALAEILDQRELEPLELDAICRELEQQGVEVIDDERAPPLPLAPETTTDALQLFLRDVGRPGGRARARRHGADDSDAGAHRRADAEAEPDGADALDGARARADARGGGRASRPSAPAGARGEGGGPRLGQSRSAARRAGGSGLWRPSRRRGPAAGGEGRGHAAKGSAGGGTRGPGRARADGDHPPLRRLWLRAEDARGDRPGARGIARASAPAREG